MATLLIDLRYVGRTLKSRPLFTTGGLVRSFWQILAVDPGFSASHTTTAQIPLSAQRYLSDACAIGFWDRLCRAAITLPASLNQKKRSLNIYLPYSQLASPLCSALILRTRLGSNLTASELQHLVESIDLDVPISECKSPKLTVDKSLGQRRFLLGLLVTFTLLAIELAVTGLYAILSFTVGQRRKDTGIRVAIGASRARVLWMVLRDSLVMAAVGLMVDLVGACWCTALLQSLLFGVKPIDALAYLGAALLIALITVGAGTGPALRAAGIDPAIALRCE